MSDSIRLPRGRRDDYIIMPPKYDSSEFKANNSFVSSQSFNLVPHNRRFENVLFIEPKCCTKLNGSTRLNDYQPNRYSHQNDLPKQLLSINCSAKLPNGSR